MAFLRYNGYIKKWELNRVTEDQVRYRSGVVVRLRCYFARCFVPSLFVGLMVLFSAFQINPACGIAKQSTISVATDTNTLSATILASPTGEFGQSTNSTITISTDNYTGYTLKFAATSSSTSLEDRKSVV